MKNLILSLCFSMFCLGGNIAQAVDLGKRGTSFVVKEEGFVSMMISKLNTIDLKKEQEKMENIARDRIENPVPVAGLVLAAADREFWYDPSYTLEEDIVLPCGKILHKAGVKVNPLDHMDLERRLIFIDAREERQIEWLKEQLLEKSGNAIPLIQDRIILVAGSVFKLQEELGLQIYFDQSGELTKKFGIKASPAIAYQDGKMLKIKELSLNE
jgi:conjugal transfer pilus assembly protein TraW